MRLSRAGDYGLRVVLELSRREPGETVSARELATLQGVPAPFLAKVIGMLVEAGLVRTRRGVTGGAQLARAPEDITVLEVVEAIEGPIVLNECLLEPGTCPKIKTCTIHEVWEEAQSRLRDALSKTSFAELTRDKGELETLD